MIIPELEGLTLAKAHGAGNDFVLVPDFSSKLDLSPEAVAALCDRHFGIGADGVIRVVRSQNAPEAAGEAEWFMDYRNADGSIAEMCGNGVRVFVHYLRVQGIVDLPVGGSIVVDTRAGAKTVAFDGRDYTVDMGEYSLPHGPGGADTRVNIPSVGVREAISVAMPNPHTVVLLSSDEELAAARLTEAVSYEPVPRKGTNLELVSLGSSPASMRVLERGVGETLACGTGTCAAAVAVLLARGLREGTVDLRAPGGELSVRIEGGRAYLTGPAVLVAEFGLVGLAGYGYE